MLNILALRNARRLWKDYATCFLTLCVITALMSAFHSLLFSKDIYHMINFGKEGEVSAAGGMLIFFMVFATAAILLIVAWLINYMTRFILEKRSREFAIYLLCGMKRRQISDLYIKENLLLGLLALFVGLLSGSGLQQVLQFIFYKSVGKNYQVSARISVGSMLLTIFLFGMCFAAALFRNRKKFSRMEIIQLMQMERQNEIVDERKNRIWIWLFLISTGNIVLLYLLIFTGNLTKGTAALEMAGLMFTFYFFYLGLSAFFVRYMKKRGKLIYRNENIFLFRQLSSKMRNTCFTLGTLSLLFMFALVGSSLAFMLNDYQSRQLDVEYPFDIIILSDDTGNTFEKEEALIRGRAAVGDMHKYCVYHNRTSAVRDYLYQNLKVFTGADEYEAEGKLYVDYYDYDVYMGITDYNRLRQMLGYRPAALGEGQYLIHLPNRVYQEIKDKEVQLEDCLSTDLSFAGYQTEGFAQAGHNGADYLIVVPDGRLTGMERYFSLMAVMAQGDVPEDLSEQLYRQAGKTRGFDELIDYIRIGSEELFLTPATIQVKSREVLELKFLMSTLSFPLFYIGLVFLCVSLTVLSVQQLSDSNKYKVRYQILHKIGLDGKRIRLVVAKQLFFHYLCPIFISVLVSAAFILYTGRQFVVFTGIHTGWFLYFGVSLAGFLGVYILYFAITYIQFAKNILIP